MLRFLLKLCLICALFGGVLAGGSVSAQNITISTVGLVPQIHRYASERQPYRLIVSLTSASSWPSSAS